MATTVTPALSARKATAGPIHRSGDSLQRGRQGAMRGYGEKVAKAVGISWHTLQNELDDAARDPVRRVADRLRALRAAGASPDRLSLYALEVLVALKPVAGMDLTAAMDIESQIDADENVVGDRALSRHLQPDGRRAWAEQLRRQAAASLALADQLDPQEAVVQ